MAKRWKCSACQKKFKSHQIGQNHIQTVHPEPRLIYMTDEPPVSRSLDPEDYVSPPEAKSDGIWGLLDWPLPQ